MYKLFFIRTKTEMYETHENKAKQNRDVVINYVFETRVKISTSNLN